jgi:beclin 1
MQSDIYILQREADFIENNKIYYSILIDRINNNEKNKKLLYKNDKNLDNEMKELEHRLLLAKKRKEDSIRRRIIISKELYDINILRKNIIERYNKLIFEYNTIHDHDDSILIESSRISLQMKKFMQINVINDAFYIWYSGSFATINNFRLGNLPLKSIEWTEINAALGQAVLAVTIIANKANISFKKYILIPMGSFPKVCKIEDKRSQYSLYTDGSFSLFPKRNFNTALIGFLTCVQELGDHVTKHDPTLQLPYNINVNDGKINDQVVILGSDDEQWTRALKLLLADIKWIIAWSTKHLSQKRSSY